MLTRLPLLLLSALAAPCAAAQSGRTDASSRLSEVRGELEKAYAESADGFKRFDVAAVMALRTGLSHRDAGRHHADRAAMELYITGIMNGIHQWNALTLTIDSLELRGDTAFVTLTQHLDRMALRPDTLAHHVETWATQREIWVKHGSRWLMWRVDQVRNQRRLVDRKPL